MAKPLWKTPIYELLDNNGKSIKVNVTQSVSAGLTAKGAVYEVIKYLKSEKIESVLDFGAGALRHCFPFLELEISVCAVEFKEQFSQSKGKCAEALNRASQNQHFSKLIYPDDFIKDKRKFDLILLCYVLNIMPIPNEREKVVDYLQKKLNNGGYLLYMAQWNNKDGLSEDKKVSDGYYKGPDKYTYKTFYKDTKTDDTHSFFEAHKLIRKRSFSNNGNEQIFLYRKEGDLWA